MLFVMSEYLPLLFIAAFGFTALHFTLLWMEEKGWVYYKKKPNGSGYGNALQEFEALMNPSVRVILEEKHESKEEDVINSKKP